MFFEEEKKIFLDQIFVFQNTKDQLLIVSTLSIARQLQNLLPYTKLLRSALDLDHSIGRLVIISKWHVLWDCKMPYRLSMNKLPFIPHSSALKI